MIRKIWYTCWLSTGQPRIPRQAIEWSMSKTNLIISFEEMELSMSFDNLFRRARWLQGTRSVSGGIIVTTETCVFLIYDGDIVIKLCTFQPFFVVISAKQFCSSSIRPSFRRARRMTSFVSMVDLPACLYCGQLLADFRQLVAARDKILGEGLQISARIV